jgi:LuxR family maltose regulon positive regulatory protein
VDGAAIVLDFGEVTASEVRTPLDETPIQLTLARLASELSALGLTTTLSYTQVVPIGHPELAELSPGETEVLNHLVGGSRVLTIAEDLSVQPSTIRNHLKSIYRKLSVGSQRELLERINTLRG